MELILRTTNKHITCFKDLRVTLKELLTKIYKLVYWQLESGILRNNLFGTPAVRYREVMGLASLENMPRIYSSNKRIHATPSIFVCDVTDDQFIGRTYKIVRSSGETGNFLEDFLFKCLALFHPRCGNHRQTTWNT